MSINSFMKLFLIIVFLLISSDFKNIGETAMSDEGHDSETVVMDDKISFESQIFMLNWVKDNLLDSTKGQLGMKFWVLKSDFFVKSYFHGNQNIIIKCETFSNGSFNCGEFVESNDGHDH